jgi:acyl-CoA thioesterase-1
MSDRDLGSVRDVYRIMKNDRMGGLRFAAFLIVAFALTSFVGCSPGRDSQGAVATLSDDQTSSTSSAAPRIVCLGDSLTAGLGLPPEQAYPAMLQQRVRARGYPHEVINAGVSGDTSAGGLRRLDWALTGDTRVLVLALGANDALRGLPAAALRQNLDAIIKQAHEREIAVLLTGLEAPPNLGPAYTKEFRAVYAGLAQQYDLAFVPFLLEGVAGVSRLNQADGIHPTAKGQRVMADLLWPKLEPLLVVQGTR